MAPVFSVTSDQMNVWLITFIWPFVRMLSLVATAPIFGEATIPKKVKVFLAALLAFVITPTLGPLPAISFLSAPGLWILVQQVLIGSAMGFSMKLVFAIAQAAGEYSGLQMGLSFATFFDPTSGGSTSVASRILNVMIGLLFLATNSHLLLIMTLADSFQTLPISDSPLAAGGWYLLVLAGSQIVTGGLMLALPLVATLLTINLAMGILNRVSPQFSIFSVGFPITLMAGVSMMQILIQYLGPFMEPQFATALTRIPLILQAFRQ